MDTCAVKLNIFPKNLIYISKYQKHIPVERFSITYSIMLTIYSSATHKYQNWRVVFLPAQETHRPPGSSYAAQ